MTGSGTLADPYIIENVTDLQAMKDNLTAYYELGQNIDASATSGWNANAGFEPIGKGQKTTSLVVPESDHSSGGSWTVYPTSPATMYDKVDEGPTNGYHDGDATYIQSTGSGAYALFPATMPSIPSDVYRVVVIVALYYRKTNSNSCKIQRYLRMNGVNYLIGPSYNPTTSYSGGAVWITTNPATGAAWKYNEVADIEAFGVYVHTNSSYFRLTRTYIAAICWHYFRGSFSGNDYEVSNLFIDRASTDGTGLFGNTLGATIQDIKLLDVDITGQNYTGSLVGYTAGGETIRRMVVSGEVVGVNYVGGLIGYDNESDIDKCCVVSGNVTGQDYVGGFIGRGYHSVHDNCYTRAATTGNRFVGGYVGQSYSTFTYAYSTGVVVGVDYVGGFCGENNRTITSCYWDKETSGKVSSDGGTGKTTTQMKTKSTFREAGWDFINIWVIRADINDSYPSFGKSRIGNVILDQLIYQHAERMGR